MDRSISFRTRTVKKLILSIGLLLAPALAHAQISTSTGALSPWVQAVLDRADAGILLAESFSDTSCNAESVESEIRNNQQMIRTLITPLTEREGEAEMLRESTVCFQDDKHRLELKMREIQEAMNAAVRACKLSTSKALRENAKSLGDAYRSFLVGGMNPSYKDDTLRYRRSFHDSDLWAAGIGTPIALTGSTAPLCPYTTDYGAHSIGFVPTMPSQSALLGTPSFEVRSYGCDQTVLATLAPHNPEAATLLDFMNQTQSFSASLYDTVTTALFHLDTVLGVLTGKLPASQIPGSKVPPPHAKQDGCLKPIPPDFATDDPAQINALLTAYPDYFESYNLREDSAGALTYSPLPEETLPVGILSFPIVDYFLAVPNAGILTRSYIDLRENVGIARPLPQNLVSSLFDSFLNAIMRTTDTANELKKISSNIEREMGILESDGTDALERMQDASVPLESAVQSLITVVNTELPERYIPGLTFFLARSCVDGHCQKTLEAVAKRTFNPYCHPYVSGKYMEDDAAKRCYCHEDIEKKDPAFWTKYCSADLSDDMARYDALEPTLVPACVEESAVLP